MNVGYTLCYTCTNDVTHAGEKMHKILLLEDDKYLRTTLTEELEEASYSVIATDKSEEAIEYTYAEKFDLYLFDINVIGMNGFELLALLRDAGDETPTIFLTSKNKTSDVITGFDRGADDYMKKPFDMDELFVRIRRLVSVKKQYKITETIYYLPETYEVINGDTRIILHAKDAQILEFFLTHPNQIVSKEQILCEVYEDTYITDTTFRGYINKLKMVIGKEALRNIRGQGYIFETL